MPTPRVHRDANITLRVDADVLLWARARAWFGCTSVNALIRDFLAEYAAVPDRWWAGLPPPWTPEDRIRPVMDPVGAGLRAADAAEPARSAVVEAMIEATQSRQG
jgi:hypothetical protein